MTAKEKANQLIELFKTVPTNPTYSANVGDYPNFIPKKLALICADEVILEAKGYRYKYWQDVKQELEKL